MAKGSLTPKQKRFGDEFLVDLNATAAYKRAGYSVHSDAAAAVEGHKLLKNPKVAGYIAERQKAREHRTEITQDRVLQELAKIGFSNMSDYSEWGPRGVTLRESGQLSSEQSAVVAEVSQSWSESGGSIKFKLHDKVAALEKIGRHLGMFKDQLTLKGGLDNTTQDIGSLSPEERRARIDELNRRRGTGAHSPPGR